MSEAQELQITVESMKRVDLVTVNGRIDSHEAPKLDASLKEIMDDGRHNLVLELNNVSFMSSAGLRALVSALRECKRNRGDVRLAMPSDRVMEVLDLAGLAPLFETYDDVTTAVGSF